MPGNRRGGGNCPTDDFFSAKPHNAGAAGVSGASRKPQHRTKNHSIIGRGGKGPKNLSYIIKVSGSKRRERGVEWSVMLGTSILGWSILTLHSTWPIQ